jgi:catechol 2,3-dioxygenase-like lactoylglutathione lyase family enzyme
MRVVTGADASHAAARPAAHHRRQTTHSAHRMIHHLDLPVTDLARSRAFYESALAPLGLTLVAHHRHQDGHEVLGYGVRPDPLFWIRNGRELAAKVHVAFLASTHQEVREFYAAALGAGGVSNGEPGFRLRYAEHYYAAFVFDPDGNNIEVVCRAPSRETP